MEPSHILLMTIIVGAIGSVLLTVLFLFFASFVIDCPNCKQRIRRRSVFCSQCGDKLLQQSRPVSSPVVADASPVDAKREQQITTDILKRFRQLPLRSRVQLTEILNDEL